MTKQQPTPPATALSAAILRTVSYGDVFDHALTAAEIHRYLHQHPASPAQVHHALATADFLGHQQGLYTLVGRDELIPLRHKRAQRAQQMWPHALRYGRWLARAPFVRMVALTGSLAVRNPTPTADIDYFVLTTPGRVWLARLFCLALVRTAAQQGHTLCPNYFLATTALALAPHNLYTARELAQMVPLAGQAAYQQLRRANGWTADFLPNAIGAPPLGRKLGKPERPTQFHPVEMALSHSLGNRLEAWEMGRKIRKLSAVGRNPETHFTAEQCKGHFEGHQTRTLRQWNQKQIVMDTSPPHTDILFGQSYYLRFDPKLYAAMQPYPPLGTMFAAALMRQQGYQVALFDAMLAESTADWTAALQQHQPRYAVLYEDNFNYLSKMCLLNMREAAVAMITAAKTTHATVILCGADATDHPELYLQAGADYVLAGEGEETLTELVAWLEQEPSPTAPPTHIAGLIWPGQQTPRRPSMRHIDHLPFPAWDLIDVEQYRHLWHTHHGYFSMNMVTTRGCPYHCNWCAKPIWGQRYASRSPANVAAELQWLRQTYQPDHISFVDDIMGLKPDWWQQFAQIVVRENIRTPFKCLSRADLIVRHPANVQALHQAGCEMVWLGAESGSQAILDSMEKGTTVEQIVTAAEQLHAAGIQVAFFLQFGYPSETRADIEKTLQMVRDCQPDDIGMSVSYPLPGTRFHERVKLELGKQQNWTDSADLAMLYHGPFSTSFYRQLHTVLHKEFRARKGWRTLRQVALRPASWRPKHGRLLAATLAHVLTLPFARRTLNQLAETGSTPSISLPHMPHAQAARPTEMVEEG